MQLTFKFEEFEIVEEVKDGYVIWTTVLCEIDLIMVEPPQAEINPSLNHPGEPGWPAEFEIIEIRLIDPVITLTLTETQFATFFVDGEDVMNNAYEWASEQNIEWTGKQKMLSPSIGG